MIRITKSDCETVAEIHAHHYRLANHQMVFQEPVSALSAFSEGPASSSFSSVLSKPSHLDVFGPENAVLEYEGQARFENRMQNVECWVQGKVRQINVDGKPVCRVSIKDRHIHLLNDNSFDEQLNLEVVTGPALIILMARRKTYCMHAGAVSTPYGNIAFIAESGLGKSTLSAHESPQWRQLSDDILPIRLRNRKAFLSDYPQLKLRNAHVEEPVRSELELNLIVRLSADQPQQPEFRRMSNTEAMLEIVRHTVAAKLFDQKQMTQHTSYAKRLCLDVPIVELSYPRDLEKLTVLRRAITDYLQVGQFD